MHREQAVWQATQAANWARDGACTSKQQDCVGGLLGLLLVFDFVYWHSGAPAIQGCLLGWKAGANFYAAAMLRVLVLKSIYVSLMKGLG
jgi:hypothetical protein